MTKLSALPYIPMLQFNFLAGHYNCTGYNRRPNSETDEENKQSVEVIVVKDVEASITSNLGSDEVDLGSELNLTCKVAGGRTPFYLSVQFTDGFGNVSTIIEYDESKQQGTITRNKNFLEYVHVIDQVEYTHNGLYKCVGKNIARGKREKSDETSKDAVVGKKVDSSGIEFDLIVYDCS